MVRQTTALAFADWCALRRWIARYLLVAAVASGCMAFATSGTAGPADGASLCAEGASMACAMCVYTIVMALFGADEANGWQAMRLDMLPVTRDDAVRARYLVVAGCAALTALVCSLLGAGEVLLVGAIRGIAFQLPPAGVLLAVTTLTSALVLAVAGLAMVAFFSMPANMARLVAMLPFMACLLLLVPGVGDGLSVAVGSVVAAVSALPLAAQVGLGVAACLAVYLVGMLASMALYRRREL